MNANQLLSKYLNDLSTLQIATVDGNQPWVCTVRFLSDKQHNLYWMSLPTRRHSQEIDKHSKVACTVVVQNIIGKPVIGVQIEGKAAMQESSPNNLALAKRYAAKFNRDQQWVDDFVAERTEHRLYKLTPVSIYLFDEENFPGGQRQKVL